MMRTGESIELERVKVRFGEFTAVEDVNLTIEPGEFFSFLGPSGCGKTTLLRLISGFIDPTEGAVRIGAKDMAGIGPNVRPTVLIFQNLALFPLMSVADNIAFGLEVRGVDRATRRKKALELLDLVALPDVADRKIAELSGGQRQRVAIARALAVEPKVMLLDEPLSALDLKLRQHMRAELRAIQKRTGVTFIYITHDQGEALTMSDRVAVMSRGRIQQVDAPARIYDHPANAFVASFVGENNVFAGKVTRVADGMASVDSPIGRLTGVNGGNLTVGDEAILFVRPERVALLPADGKADNLIDTELTATNFEGSFAHLIMAGTEDRDITVHLPNDGAMASFEIGRACRVGFGHADAVVLAKSELARD